MSLKTGRMWTCDTCAHTEFKEGYNVNSMSPPPLPEGWIKVDDSNDKTFWNHFCCKKCLIIYCEKEETNE